MALENVAGAFRGQLLIATAAVVSFLVLMYVSEKLVDGSKGRILQRSFAIALMVAIGIGLHNLGEGLAIGGAMVVGEVALSTFLIVGFTIHNTTEGLAIVSPMAKQKPKILYLVALGLIASAPAIAGAWIGGFVSSSIASITFLAIGAGAIFQVVLAIFRMVGYSDGQFKFLTGRNVAGVTLGFLIMYLTALLIETLYILTSRTRLMTKTLSIDDQTYRRLTSILNDMMHTKKHDVDYSDVIDVLIDVYQDSLTFSGENAGG